MTNYFDSPSRSPSGNDSKLVIGGTSEIDGVEFNAEKVKQGVMGNYTGGFYDYSDAGTSITPISVVGGIDALVTNDGQGAFTITKYGIDGIDVYNEVTNSFDFSGLSLGDIVRIRIDLLVTTTSNNQEVGVYLKLGEIGGQYKLYWASNSQYKNQSTYQISDFSSLHIGNDATKNNPAQFFVETDNNASVVVNGWFIEVMRRTDNL